MSKDNTMPSVLVNHGTNNTQANQRTRLQDFETSRNQTVTLTFLGCPCTATKISLNVENQPESTPKTEEAGEHFTSCYGRERLNVGHLHSPEKSSVTTNGKRLTESVSENDKQSERRPNCEYPEQTIVGDLEQSLNRCDVEENITAAFCSGDKNIKDNADISEISTNFRTRNEICDSAPAYSLPNTEYDGESRRDGAENKGSNISSQLITRKERPHSISPRRSTSSTSDTAQRKRSLERSNEGKTAIFSSQRLRSGFRIHKHKPDGRFIDDSDGTNEGSLSIDHLEVDYQSLTKDVLLGERAHGDNEITKSPPKVDTFSDVVDDLKELTGDSNRPIEHPVTGTSTITSLKSNNEDSGHTSITKSASTGHRNLSKAKSRSRGHPNIDRIFIDVMKVLVTQSDPQTPCQCQDVDPCDVQLEASDSLSDLGQCYGTPYRSWFSAQNTSHAGELDNVEYPFDPCQVVEDIEEVPYSTNQQETSNPTMIFNIPRCQYHPRLASEEQLDVQDRNSHNQTDEEQVRCGDFWSISDPEYPSSGGSSRESCGSNEDADERPETDDVAQRRLSVREMVRTLQDRLVASSQPSTSREQTRMRHNRGKSESPTPSFTSIRKRVSDLNRATRKQQDDSSCPTAIHRSRARLACREGYSLSIPRKFYLKGEKNHVERATETQETSTGVAMTQTNDLPLRHSVGTLVTDDVWQSDRLTHKSERKISKIPIRKHISQVSKFFLNSGERMLKEFAFHRGNQKTHQNEDLQNGKTVEISQRGNAGPESSLSTTTNKGDLRKLDENILIVITPPSPAPTREIIDMYEEDELLSSADNSESYLQIPETVTFALTQHPDLTLMEEREQQMIDNFRRQMEEIESEAMSKSKNHQHDDNPPILSTVSTGSAALLQNTANSFSSCIEKARNALTKTRPICLTQTETVARMKDNLVNQTYAILKVTKSHSVSNLKELKERLSSKYCAISSDLQGFFSNSNSKNSPERDIANTTVMQSVSETIVTSGDAHQPIFCLRINDCSREKRNIKQVSRFDPRRGHTSAWVDEFQQPLAPHESVPHASYATESGPHHPSLEPEPWQNRSSEENSSAGGNTETTSSDNLLNEGDNKNNQQKCVHEPTRFYSPAEHTEEKLTVLPSTLESIEETDFEDLRPSPKVKEINIENREEMQENLATFDHTEDFSVNTNSAAFDNQPDERKVVLQSCSSCCDCKREIEDSSLQDEVSSSAPIKRHSLVNATDSGHTESGVTEVMALISLEVSIKRYPSFPDLTDIHDENNPLLVPKDSASALHIPHGTQEDANQHIDVSDQPDKIEYISEVEEQLTDQQSEINSAHISLRQEQTPLTPKAMEGNLLTPNSPKFGLKDGTMAGGSQAANGSNLSNDMKEADLILVGNRSNPEVTGVHLPYPSTCSSSSTAISLSGIQSQKLQELSSAANSSTDSDMNCQGKILEDKELPSPPNHSLSDDSRDGDHQDLCRENSSSLSDSSMELPVDKAQSTSKAAVWPKPSVGRNRLKRLRAALNQEYNILTEETSSALLCVNTTSGMCSLEEKHLFDESELSQSSRIFDASQQQVKDNSDSSLSLDCTEEANVRNTKDELNLIEMNAFGDSSRGAANINESGCADTKHEFLYESERTVGGEDTEHVISAYDNAVKTELNKSFHVEQMPNSEKRLEIGLECGARCAASSCATETTGLSGGVSDTGRSNPSQILPAQKIDEEERQNNLNEETTGANSGVLRNVDNVHSLKPGEQATVTSIQATPDTDLGVQCQSTSNNANTLLVRTSPQPSRYIPCKEDANFTDGTGGCGANLDESLTNKSNSCLLEESSQNDDTEETSSSDTRCAELCQSGIPVASSSRLRKMYSHQGGTEMKKTFGSAKTKSSSRLSVATFKATEQQCLKSNQNNNVSVAFSEILCGKGACKWNAGKQRPFVSQLNKPLYSAPSSKDHTASSVLDPKSGVNSIFMITSVSRIIGAPDQEEGQEENSTENAALSSVKSNESCTHVCLSDFLADWNEQHKDDGSDSQSETMKISVKSTSTQSTLTKDNSDSCNEMASLAEDTTTPDSNGINRVNHSPDEKPKISQSRNELSRSNGSTVLKTSSLMCQENSNPTTMHSPQQRSDSLSMTSLDGSKLPSQQTANEESKGMTHSLSQRIHRAEKPGTKKKDFRSRSQKQLEKCDQLIQRSSQIINMSQEMIRNSEKQMDYTAKTMNLRKQKLKILKVTEPSNTVA